MRQTDFDSSADRLTPRLDTLSTAQNDAAALLETRSAGQPPSHSEHLPDLMLAQGPGLPDRLGTASDAASGVNLASRGRYGNNPFFNASSGAVGLVTGFDVSPTTVAGWVSDSFSRIAVLNDVLGGSRPADFRPINGHDGNPAVCAVRPGGSTPTVPFRIDGADTPVAIDLPGLRGSAVVFVTDGRRIMAIDPRNNDTWQLQRNSVVGIGTGYSWSPVRRR
ncbi:MAG: hypothetical protein K2W95_08020 [Candidatus Obscuribacterales bacterium]|nr:hypothetical protein [Candidatus Obscuribacterales bacterium]